MAQAYKMYRAETIPVTFDFSPVTGPPYNDPLTGTPAVTFSPTGQLALSGSPARLTNTVTAFVDGAGGVQGTTYVVKCVADTTSGATLEINGQIVVRDDNEVP
jgi:hypothetical protein